MNSALIGTIGLASILAIGTGIKSILNANLTQTKPPLKKQPADFIIHNHFPKHSISLEVDEFTDLQLPTRVKIVDSIPPRSTHGLTKREVIEHLGGGNVLKIYILTSKGRVHYSDYTLDYDKDERIKSLHIGMMTTRYIGSTDKLRMSTNSGNAIGGNAFVKIHNLSYIPLRLNGSGDEDPSSGGGIAVAPHSIRQYKGYLHQGVTLGTIFSDDDKLYPDFQYLEPHSDIYYGVVSDIKQPLSGCWQLEFNDNCEYGQTMWPFQEGII